MFMYVLNTQELTAPHNYQGAYSSYDNFSLDVSSIIYLFCMRAHGEKVLDHSILQRSRLDSACLESRHPIKAPGTTLGIKGCQKLVLALRVQGVVHLTKVCGVSSLGLVFMFGYYLFDTNTTQLFCFVAPNATIKSPI